MTEEKFFTASEKRFAVLIDAENITGRYVKKIFDEVSNVGYATYKRIYGDWTRPQLTSWKDVLLDNSITPIQQYGYTVGKNSTDSAMIIDAMDILYSGKVDGFCLVSSDSDFTRLASRLRESGMYVLGMGEQKTPAAFRSACHQFKFLDLLARESVPVVAVAKKRAQRPKSSSSKSGGGALIPARETIMEEIKKIIAERSDDAGRAFLGEVGGILSKRFPDFDVRNYGFDKLSNFVRGMDDLVVELKPAADTNVRLAFVGLKSRPSKEGDKEGDI